MYVGEGKQGFLVWKLLKNNINTVTECTASVTIKEYCMNLLRKSRNLNQLLLQTE